MNKRYKYKYNIILQDLFIHLMFESGDFINNIITDMMVEYTSGMDLKGDFTVIANEVELGVTVFFEREDDLLFFELGLDGDRLRSCFYNQLYEWI